MQWTVPAPPSATPARPLLTVSPQSLTAAFAHLPDPRRARSVPYALPALLALAVAAILCTHLSVLAIAEWGARQSPDLLRTLGFTEGCTPCQSTLQRLFSTLDGHALAAALSAHFAPPVMPLLAGDGAQGGPSMARRSGGASPSRTGAAPCMP
jgi:DDE_Tnp_1-associated